MDAIKYASELGRMCSSFKARCTECKIAEERSKQTCTMGCWAWIAKNPEKAVSIVEQWSNEHPVKTCLEDFGEKYPKGISGSYVWCNLYNNAEYHKLCENALDCDSCPGWSEPAEKYL